MCRDRQAFVVAVQITGLLKAKLGWEPSEKLILGIEKTYAWINKQIFRNARPDRRMVLRPNNGGAAARRMPLQRTTASRSTASAGSLFARL